MKRAFYACASAKPIRDSSNYHLGVVSIRLHGRGRRPGIQRTVALVEHRVRVSTRCSRRVDFGIPCTCFGRMGELVDTVPPDRSGSPYQDMIDELKEIGSRSMSSSTATTPARRSRSAGRLPRPDCATQVSMSTASTSLSPLPPSFALSASRADSSCFRCFSRSLAAFRSASSAASDQRVPLHLLPLPSIRDFWCRTSTEPDRIRTISAHRYSSHSL